MECDKHGIIGCELCNPTVAPPRIRFTDQPQAVFGSGSRRWSPLEHSIAEDLNYTHAEVAELLDRTPTAVYMYRLAKGIITQQQERNLNYDVARVMARWTPEEEQFLADHSYLAMDTLVALLGRSADSIRAKMRGLK